MKFLRHFFTFLIALGFLTGLPIAPTFAAADPQGLGCPEIVAIRAAELQQEIHVRLGGLVILWARQDAEVAAARQRFEEGRIKEWEMLEESLTAMPTVRLGALQIFKAAMVAAATQRQLAIDSATKNFRMNVPQALQATAETEIGAPAACSKISPDIPRPENFQLLQNSDSEGALAIAMRRLDDQYRADIHAITIDFKVAVLDAVVNFRAVLED